MSTPVDALMYGVSQLFLLPVLIAIGLLFGYAFYALGAFCWQARQRRAGVPEGFELLAACRADPALGATELELRAVERLELARIATRIAPMLGLVATMIPMGPALKALGEGALADVSANLMVAFSAVILALVAASITYCTVSVRRRWYAHELALVEGGASAPPVRRAAAATEGAR